MKARLFLLILIILAAAFNIPMFERLAITNEKSGNIVFLDNVQGYKEFYISFTHSVNRTPVNEYYRIVGERFVLEKAAFYSYGAGMPESGEYGSAKPSVKDGMVVMEGINKEFKKFTYYAGTYAKHSLNADGKQIYFSQFVRPQTPVTFEIKRVSIISLLTYRWYTTAAEIK